jgi:hypothetical protein
LSVLYPNHFFLSLTLRQNEVEIWQVFSDEKKMVYN